MESDDFLFTLEELRRIAGWPEAGSGRSTALQLPNPPPPPLPLEASQLRRLCLVGDLPGLVLSFPLLQLFSLARMSPVERRRLELESVSPRVSLLQMFARV